MSPFAEPPSKTRVDKAGARLRDQAIGPVILDAVADQIREADISTVTEYRRSYADPLLKVRMGLTSFKATIGYPDAAITQRTKRYSRIVTKLVRFPRLRLSQMQDIGGVRVVMNGLAESDAMVDKVLQQWGDHVRRHDDYASNPQDSGYRGHHVVVLRDDRLIEIQIRTENQHTWAESVESIGRMIGLELKWGDGPEEIFGYYSLLGEVVDLADQGADISNDLVRRTRAAEDEARRSILQVLEGGGSNG